VQTLARSLVVAGCVNGMHFSVDRNVHVMHYRSIAMKHGLGRQMGMELNRKRLARIAYIAAADRLLASCDAGTMSREAGRGKLEALRRAYDKRVSDIELGSFLAARGLGFILERKAA